MIRHLGPLTTGDLTEARLLRLYSSRGTHACEILTTVGCSGWPGTVVLGASMDRVSRQRGSSVIWEMLVSSAVAHAVLQRRNVLVRK